MFRKNKILYLGTDPSHFKTKDEIFHYPVIRVQPREIPEIPKEITHVLVTSKNTAVLLREQILLENPFFIAVGKITALTLKKRGIKAHYIAKNESQEGIIEILETLNLSKAHLFFPHSSLSRPLIFNYLKEKKIVFTEQIYYDTIVNAVPLIDLHEFDEIVFTSPSTVDAFLSLYHKIPEKIKIRAIGAITQKKIDNYRDFFYC